MALSPPPFYREIAAEMGLPLEEKTLTTVLSDGSLRSDYTLEAPMWDPKEPDRLESQLSVLFH